jgi:hypothetical protein
VSQRNPGPSEPQIQRKDHIVIESQEHSFVRLLTEDSELLVPALLQRGASLHLRGRTRVDVRGMSAADIAWIAAFHNARVDDLRTVQDAQPAC